jgi:hypothetical protein
MSNRGAGVRGAAVPFAPKLNVRSEAGDSLDTAAQHTLDLLHRAAPTSYWPNFEPLKTGYESLITKPDITRIGRIGLRGGCIKSQWRLSRISLEGTTVVPHSPLRKQFPARSNRLFISRSPAFAERRR